jgi:hypothetical protein
LKAVTGSQVLYCDRVDGIGRFEVEDPRVETVHHVQAALDGRGFPEPVPPSKAKYATGLPIDRSRLIILRNDL